MKIQYLVLKDSWVVLLLLAVRRAAHQNFLYPPVEVEHVGVRRRRRRQPVDVGEGQRRKGPLGGSLGGRQRAERGGGAHGQGRRRPE
jgi:hypothetical protein